MYNSELFRNFLLAYVSDCVARASHQTQQTLSSCFIHQHILCIASCCLLIILYTSPRPGLVLFIAGDTAPTLSLSARPASSDSISPCLTPWTISNELVNLSAFDSVSVSTAFLSFFLSLSVSVLLCPPFCVFLCLSATLSFILSFSLYLLLCPLYVSYSVSVHLSLSPSVSVPVSSFLFSG